MASWLDALSRTRQKFAGALNRILGRDAAPDEDSLEDLEACLLAADISPRLVGELIQQLEKPDRGGGSLRDRLRASLLTASGDHPHFEWPTDESPFTILLVGINGSGKTTTSAKLAHLARNRGRKVLLGATDTFRAAGVEQLKLWAGRVGCEVVGGQSGSDAASVAFDALGAAQARGMDVLLIDTAGRMHTKKPLMAELDKMRRALQKRLPSAPHETWVVLDAALGQNALGQARYFNEVVPLTGVVITKLDGSSKGGFLLSVIRELGVPVRFVGLGEGPDDLAPFDPREFVDALLGERPTAEAPAHEALPR